jgi:predicted lactoylglutathione lyase
MPTSIFVNLPTTDLERSKDFYTSLGFSINPLFTDENAACVVLDDNIYFMVLTREYLGTFTDKQIIDPKTHAQVSIAITRDSRDEVDEVVAKGLAAGGTEPREAQDYGFSTRATSKTPTATSSRSSSWSRRPPRWAPRRTWPSRAPRPRRPRPDTSTTWPHARRAASASTAARLGRSSGSAIGGRCSSFATCSSARAGTAT